jgi:hypothetical protein
MLRSVKNLVIISEALEDTVFYTNFVKSAFHFFLLFGELKLLMHDKCLQVFT